jgi:uncharacterized membrane protein
MENVHPLIVHFPIALFTAGFVVDVVGYMLKKDLLKNAGLVMVVLGAVGAVAANLSGRQAEEIVEKFLSHAGEEALESHETFGNITVFVLPAAAVLNLFGAFIIKGKKRAARVLLGCYFAVGLLGLIMVTATGYKGGHLVYGHGGGVSREAFQTEEGQSHDHDH